MKLQPRNRTTAQPHNRTTAQPRNRTTTQKYKFLCLTYKAQDAGSAYLMVTSITNGTSNNYIIDTKQNSITIDVSTYTNGTYNIALVCDGQIQDSKNLLKQ